MTKVKTNFETKLAKRREHLADIHANFTEIVKTVEIKFNELQTSDEFAPLELLINMSGFKALLRETRKLKRLYYDFRKEETNEN